MTAALIGTPPGSVWSRSARSYLFQIPGGCSSDPGAAAQGLFRGPTGLVRLNQSLLPREGEGTEKRCLGLIEADRRCRRWTSRRAGATSSATGAGATEVLSRFEKWNLTKSGVASRDAIASSSRRTHLYRPGLTQKQRYGGPCWVWDLKLEDLVLDYAEMSARGEPCIEGAVPSGL